MTFPPSPVPPRSVLILLLIPVLTLLAVGCGASEASRSGSSHRAAAVELDTGDRSTASTMSAMSDLSDRAAPPTTETTATTAPDECSLYGLTGASGSFLPTADTRSGPIEEPVEGTIYFELCSPPGEPPSSRFVAYEWRG